MRTSASRRWRRSTRRPRARGFAAEGLADFIFVRAPNRARACATSSAASTTRSAARSRSAVEPVRGRAAAAGRRVPLDPERSAPRLRGHRPARRRVHHLQHVHDPRGAAHTRARPPAGDGRERHTGRRIRPGRGARHGDGRVGRRVRAGIGLGKVLLWALPGFGVPVPARSLVVLARTVWACAIVGVGVTMSRRSARDPGRRAPRRSRRSATSAPSGSVGRWAADRRCARARAGVCRRRATGSGAPDRVDRSVALTFSVAIRHLHRASCVSARWCSKTRGGGRPSPPDACSASPGPSPAATRCVTRAGPR